MRRIEFFRYIHQLQILNKRIAQHYVRMINSVDVMSQ